MNYKYNTTGVCARTITFDLTDGIVSNVTFSGGCDGNHKGVSALANGKTAEEIISALSGIRCGFRETSCPDQLAVALKKALEEAK